MYLDKIDDTIAILRAGWTQRVFARKADGEITSIDDPEACKFCVNGAFVKACGYKSVGPEASIALRTLEKWFIDVVGCNSVEYNDDVDTNVDDVIRVLETAKTIKHVEVA